MQSNPFQIPTPRLYHFEYWCLQRPIWRSAEGEGFPPATSVQEAAAQLRRLLAARRNNPVRVIDDNGAELMRLP